MAGNNNDNDQAKGDEAHLEEAGPAVPSTPLPEASLAPMEMELPNAEAVAAKT